MMKDYIIGLSFDEFIHYAKFISPNQWAFVSSSTTASNWKTTWTYYPTTTTEETYVYNPKWLTSGDDLYTYSSSV